MWMGRKLLNDNFLKIDARFISLTSTRAIVALNIAMASVNDGGNCHIAERATLIVAVPAGHTHSASDQRPPGENSSFASFQRLNIRLPPHPHSTGLWHTRNIH